MLLAGCSRANTSTPETLSPRTEPHREHPTSKGAPLSNPGVAVVELFTSEGCSSCPAADAVLARVANAAERSGARIFTVELHVDYWDYLGWRDPFDDARFSARQTGYRALSGSTYTPQAVVNGEKEAVGSDESRLNELIAQVLKVPATTRLMLTAEWSDGGLLVRCAGDAAEAQTLNLFVLETRAESAVSRGENAGEHLQHRNVARAFESRSVPSGQFQATWRAQLPPDVSRSGVSALAFAQRRHQAGITGAIRAMPR